MEAMIKRADYTFDLVKLVLQEMNRSNHNYANNDYDQLLYCMNASLMYSFLDACCSSTSNKLIAMGKHPVLYVRLDRQSLTSHLFKAKQHEPFRGCYLFLGSTLFKLMTQGGHYTLLNCSHQMLSELWHY